MGGRRCELACWAEAQRQSAQRARASAGEEKRPAEGPAAVGRPYRGDVRDAVRAVQATRRVVTMHSAGEEARDLGCCFSHPTRCSRVDGSKIWSLMAREFKGLRDASGGAASMDGGAACRFQAQR
jgi:hypothetical protein